MDQASRRAVYPTLEDALASQALERIAPTARPPVERSHNASCAFHPLSSFGVL
jgi:hypothetical protein